MTQEPPLSLGPPPRKAHVRRAIRNMRRAYATLFALVILVFGGWALLDALRWEDLKEHERFLTIGFGLTALLAVLVLRLVDRPLQSELRLARRGEVAVAQIRAIGKSRGRRPAPMIAYAFRTAGGAAIEGKCVLPRRFPIHSLAPGMSIEVLYDPRKPRLNKPRAALQFVEFSKDASGRG
jgi:hypothetical protein